VLKRTVWHAGWYLKQNQKITEIGKKFESKIIRVVGFEHLVNIVLISLDEIGQKMEKETIGMYTLYESKTASIVRFVLYNSPMKSAIFSSGDIPVQVSDAPEKY